MPLGNRCHPKTLMITKPSHRVSKNPRYSCQAITRLSVTRPCPVMATGLTTIPMAWTRQATFDRIPRRRYVRPRKRESRSWTQKKMMSIHLLESPDFGIMGTTIRQPYMSILRFHLQCRSNLHRTPAQPLLRLVYRVKVIDAAMTAAPKLQKSRIPNQNLTTTSGSTVRKTSVYMSVTNVKRDSPTEKTSIVMFICIPWSE
jgi:hypothetical protein